MSSVEGRLPFSLFVDRLGKIGSTKDTKEHEGVGQYVVYRNENENPGNAKHQLGLFSEEEGRSSALSELELARATR